MYTLASWQPESALDWHRCEHLRVSLLFSYVPLCRLSFPSQLLTYVSNSVEFHIGLFQIGLFYWLISSFDFGMKKQSKIVIIVILIVAVLLLCGICGVIALVMTESDSYEQGKERAREELEQSDIEGEDDLVEESDPEEEGGGNEEQQGEKEIPPFDGDEQLFESESIKSFVGQIAASNPLYPGSSVKSITLENDTVKIQIDYDENYSPESAKNDSIASIEFVYDNNYEGVEKVNFISNLWSLHTTKDTYRDYYREMMDSGFDLSLDEIFEILSAE